METFLVKVEKSGRILIPAEWRRRLGLSEGAEVILRLDEDSIQVVGTRDQAVRRVQERLRAYVPAGRRLSDELIEERRREAARENAK